MRFVFGLRKYDHISKCFDKEKTLNIENRKKLHSLTLMHKISLGQAPDYLIDKIVRHSDLHSYNTRHRNNIAIRRVNSNIRSNTFFISIPKLYNGLFPTINKNPVQTLSINAFKKRCKIQLTNQQFPHLT